MSVTKRSDEQGGDLHDLYDNDLGVEIEDVGGDVDEHGRIGCSSDGAVNDESPVLENVAALMKELSDAVGQYFPEMLQPLKAALAVAAVGCLADNTQPIALIFVGPSGAGKTLPLSFLMPEGDTVEYFYRSDNFTAHSFVSHKADADEEQLQQIDLLPKIKDKTLITKELAPIFRGKEQDLTERFAILTSVLDGQGFESDSGAHGKRGYSGSFNFRWLGATTPLTDEALRVIANLGPRMLFYAVDRERKDTDKLTKFLGDSRHEAKKAQAREVTQVFISEFFEQMPLGSIQSGQVLISRLRLQKLAMLAQATIALRTLKNGDNREKTLFAETEYPERAALMLKHVAIGSALIHGRLEVNDEDLLLVAHVATSSGPCTRRKVFRALLKSGTATTSELVKLTGFSKPTVIERAEELEALGLARYMKGESAKGQPDRVELLDEYSALVPLFSVDSLPVKSKGAREKRAIHSTFKMKKEERRGTLKPKRD